MASSTQKNLLYTLKNYLEMLQVKVTYNTLQKTLRRHPDYPSLLAVSDVLKSWNIENMALNIPKEQFHKLPRPFLTFLNINQGIFAVVQESQRGGASKLA